MKIYCLLFTVYCLLSNCRWLIANSEFIQVPMVIHVHSNFSDGEHSVEDIAQIAERKGIKSVIFSDHALMRWEYGLWPLQDILKKRVDKNSVLKYGAKRYFQKIEEVQKKYPEILFLPGVESAPFYYWSGKHFKYHLTLHNWHKHLLITGLNHPNDYENLPLVSNPNAGVWSFKSIVLLWPLSLLVIGYWVLVKKKERKLTFGSQILIAHSRAYKVLGIVIILVGLLFLVNNYPYKYFPYDQYHGDKGVGPYQNLIQYVNAKGGVIFWAHPEAPNWEKPQEINGITLQTPIYPGDLLKTNNYTGFAILYEGYKEVGTPGGIWDQILNQYCKGIREKPIWALGELDYKAEGYLGTYLDSIQNVLLMEKQGSGKVGERVSEEEAIECLKKGRFYVLQKAKDYVVKLEEFKIETEEGKAIMGEEIRYSKPPKIKFEIKGEYELPKVLTPIKIKLIRGGEIIKIFEQHLPLEIEYIDNIESSDKTYYRLDITGPQGGKVFSNPIFVIK